MLLCLGSVSLLTCDLTRLLPPQALYASKIVLYAQGFMLMREAAKLFNWNLNYGGIALMWRGGCIIRRLVASTRGIRVYTGEMENGMTIFGDSRGVQHSCSWGCVIIQALVHA